MGMLYPPSAEEVPSILKSVTFPVSFNFATKKLTSLFDASVHNPVSQIPDFTTATLCTVTLFSLAVPETNSEYLTYFLVIEELQIV
jgi:hypothetical protein